MAFLAWTSVSAEATAVSFDQTFFFDNTTPVASSTDANNFIEIAITSTGTPFSLAVIATDLTQEDFQAQAGNFSDRLCLGIADNGDCIEYTVTPVGTFTGPIQISLGWLKDTNPITQSPLIIQAEGNDPFSSELRNQTYFPCGFGGLQTCDPDDPDADTDPADTGTTDNFSRFINSFTPQSAPTPEPATIVLLGTGLAGVLSRSRRRK